MKNTILILIIIMLIFTTTGCNQMIYELLHQYTKAESPLVQASIDDTVLIDEGGYLVQATDITYYGDYGVGIITYIENNTDKDVTIMTEYVSVNGIIIDAVLYARVNNNTTKTDEIFISIDELEKYDMDVIAKLDVQISISERNTYDNISVSEPITIETSAIDMYEEPVAPSGSIMYEDDDFTILFLGLAVDDYDSTCIELYMENRSDDTVTIQDRALTINNYIINSIMSCNLASGKVIYDRIELNEKDLNTVGIDSISGIDAFELYFHIFESISMEAVLDTDMIYMDSEGNILSAKEMETRSDEIDISGDLVYQDETFDIYSLGIVNDGIYGVCVYLAMENKSEYDYWLGVENMIVNKKSKDCLSFIDVLSGTTTLTYIELNVSSTKMDRIKNVTVDLDAFSKDSWGTCYDIEGVTIFTE